MNRVLPTSPLARRSPAAAGRRRLSSTCRRRAVAWCVGGYVLLSTLLLAPAARAGMWDNSWAEDSIWDSAFADRALASRPSWFSAGPSWLMRSLPGSSLSLGRTSTRTSSFVDRNGDPVESTTAENGYVGTLHDIFDPGIFNNIPTFAGSSGTKISGTVNPADSVAPDLFWKTDGTTGTWTSASWGTTAAGPFTNTWTGGDDAFFNATSLITYVTGTSFADITLANGITVTVTAAGTMASGTHDIIVGTGSTLTWTTQPVSTAGASNFTKDGAGIWNIGSQGNAYTGSFTVNAGTVIGTSANSFGAGAMTINGGVIQTSGGSTFAPTSLVIGGNFSFAGSGNDIWAMTVNTGSSNRTITNNTTGAATRTFSNVISGSGGITFDGTGGSGGIVLSGGNNYTGGTTLSSGLLRLSGSGTLGSSSGTLTINGGTLDLNTDSTNITRTVGALNGSGGTIVNNGTGNFFGTLVVGQGNGTGSYAGTIANNSGTGNGNIAVTKTGSGTQTLTGSNTYTGATVINGGILQLDNAGSATPRLAGTTSITVNSSGTLALSSSAGSSNDRIKDTATMKLNGGTFNTGGLSEHGAANNNAGIGALTLQSSSIIDLATGSSVVAFANSNSVLGNSAAWSGTLSIYNWSGTTVTGGGTDQLYFGNDATGLDATQLAMIQFYSGTGTGAFTAGAVILPSGEIVPVPETSTWVAGALALLAIGYTQRKKLSRLVRAAA